jgi:hypothetical protein
MRAWKTQSPDILKKDAICSSETLILLIGVTRRHISEYYTPRRILGSNYHGNHGNLLHSDGSRGFSDGPYAHITIIPLTLTCHCNCALW